MSYYQNKDRFSDDGSARHLSNANYSSAPAGDYPPINRKKQTSRWLKIGVPVALVIIIAAVVGGIVATRVKKNGDSSDSANGGAGSGDDNGKPQALGAFATATNSFSQPIYPATTNAAFAKPTFATQGTGWGADPFKPANPSPTNVRTDRPRLHAPAYKWAQLASLAADPYIKQWNDTIMANANRWQAMDPVPYEIDGGLNKSGVLDVARQVKMRIKTFAYAWLVTRQTMWADRAWKELENASGKGTVPFGTAPDNWNSAHFLDLAEFTAAFGIAYDWMYDVWTPQQKTLIRESIVTLGLTFGVRAYTAPGTVSSWWRGVNGNWNCVCNGGLTQGALAILGDDTSGLAAQMLSFTIDNAKANCAMGPSTDGTWSETPNYWYFGVTGHSEMASALLSATGSTYDLLTVNPAFKDTGMYHMYFSGNQQMFDWGDHGPNKYSTTSNAMFFYGTQFNRPEYQLFQRDRIDAADPWSIFWYDPSVAGAWWNGLALDHHFPDQSDDWVSMRSSWTDINGLFVAMKAGNHTGHQAHGNLDAGDFVIDAMGVRWAGELGSGDYLAEGYFANELQASPRWLYYRTRTEGQNCIVLGHQNQLVSAATRSRFGSSNTAQGSSTVLDVPGDSTAFFTSDLTASYGGTSVKRGIRLLNGRKQVLLQDDIQNAQVEVQWRMHTNATIALSGTSATLTLEGKRMQVSILNPPPGAQFQTLPATRYADDPAFPPGQVDQPNPGVSVLAITLPPGSYNLQVLFNPQWDGMAAGDFKTPGFVAIDGWSLTSHS